MKGVSDYIGGGVGSALSSFSYKAAKWITCAFMIAAATMFASNAYAQNGKIAELYDKKKPKFGVSYTSTQDNSVLKIEDSQIGQVQFSDGVRGPHNSQVDYFHLANHDATRTIASENRMPDKINAYFNRTVKRLISKELTKFYMYAMHFPNESGTKITPLDNGDKAITLISPYDQRMYGVVLDELKAIRSFYVSPKDVEGGEFRVFISNSDNHPSLNQYINNSLSLEEALGIEYYSAIGLTNILKEDFTIPKIFMPRLMGAVSSYGYMAVVPALAMNKSQHGGNAVDHHIHLYWIYEGGRRLAKVIPIKYKPSVEWASSVAWFVFADDAGQHIEQYLTHNYEDGSFCNTQFSKLNNPADPIKFVVANVPFYINGNSSFGIEAGLQRGEGRNTGIQFGVNFARKALTDYTNVYASLLGSVTPHSSDERILNLKWNGADFGVGASVRIPLEEMLSNPVINLGTDIHLGVEQRWDLETGVPRTLGVVRIHPNFF